MVRQFCAYGNATCSLEIRMQSALSVSPSHGPILCFLQRLSALLFQVLILTGKFFLDDQQVKGLLILCI